MRVLVIGSGGREHALLWKIKQSKRVKKLFAAPGNGGTASLAENVPVKADDIKGLLEFSLREKIDLTLVGPEVPLTMGIVDVFGEKGLRAFGPSGKAARLEASKIFTKELCRSENIPTADFEIFDNAEKAKKYIAGKNMPLVVKADGLAAGKGVIIAKTEKEASRAIDSIMVAKEFGSSGDRIIIEECLEGEEASIIVVSDGENIVPLASSQDHKRIFDNDLGSNTGGMGAYSPAPVVTTEIFNYTVSKMIKPVIKGMKKQGVLFKGVLYAGIMITKEGPKLLEFNARFGDPETQAILPRLSSDLVGLLEGSIDGTLKDYSLDWDKKSSVCVVMASGGYPEKYEKEKEIRGIEEAASLKDTFVFHAGTHSEPGSEWVVTSGGRVLDIVALGDSIKEAIDKAYTACERIKFDQMHYRKDIGHRALRMIDQKSKIKNKK